MSDQEQFSHHCLLSFHFSINNLNSGGCRSAAHDMNELAGVSEGPSLQDGDDQEGR